MSSGAEDNERISGLCQEFCSGLSSQDVPKILAKDIQVGTSNILPLVEALGVYLTSTVVENRCQGTRLLSEVLTHLHSCQLPQEDVHYLSEFYCDRLKDRALIIPHVLLGLHSMVLYQKISSANVTSISNAIFKEVHNQSLPQVERRYVYNILDSFLSEQEHIKAIQTMGSGFVLGFIQAMDGEKDPRNLIIAFSIVHRIVLNLSFDVLAEDLFEVTACYFPIDFTPPPNDPHSITREQLVKALRNCLTSTAKFSEFCLPLLLEKLSSDLLSAKLDSLHTLTAGCVTFTTNIVSQYKEVLWIALQKEVFQSVGKDVEDAAVQSLTAVTRALSRDGEQEEQEEFLRMVVKDCRHHIEEPSLKLVQPAADMMAAVAKGSKVACVQIVCVAAPLLVQHYHKQSMTSVKKMILKILLNLVNIVKCFNYKDASNPLLPYKQALFDIVVPMATDPTLLLPSLEVACGLLSLHTFMDREEVELLGGHLKELLFNSRDDSSISTPSHSSSVMMDSQVGSVRSAVSFALGKLAQLWPEVALQSLLPSALQILTLPDGEPMETDRDSLKPSPLLGALLLSSLSSHPSLQTASLSAILSLLEEVARQPVSDELLMLSQGLSGHMTIVMEKAVSGEGEVVRGGGGEEVMDGESVMIEGEEGARNGGRDMKDDGEGKEEGRGGAITLRDAAERVILFCVQPTIVEPPLERHVMMDEVVLDNCRSLLRLFSQAVSQDQRESESWAQYVCRVFVEHSIAELTSFTPLEVLAPSQQSCLLSLLTATIGALGKEVVCNHAHSLLPLLLNQSLHSSHTHITTHCAMCYASIINKLPKEGHLETVLEADTVRLWQEISSCSESEGKGERSLIVLQWLIKALVMRAHLEGKTNAVRLFSLFADQQRLASQAAACFNVVLRDTDEILNTKCNAVVKLMYKQRFFVEVIPILIRQFHAAQLGERRYYLTALGHLMQGVPKQVLVEELPSLLPLLLKSLDTEDSGLRQTTLEGLSSLLQESLNCVMDQVPSLIPRLLTLTTATDSMRVRSLALFCIGALSQLPRHLVYPYQSEVIRGLVVCLDDKKRMVRKEAVKSRAKWFLLNAV